jgi:hypothetical protein
MRFGPKNVTHGTLAHALDVVASRLETTGTDRIALVTLTRDRICLQPVHLDQGEQIARELGLDFPLDHRLLVPGHTLWTGTLDGLEVQVRASLRTLAGALR